MPSRLPIAQARAASRWCASWRRGGLALIAIALAVYLAGLFVIGPVDRDESRFAQASRQMFESIALPTSERDPALHSGGLAIPYYDTRTVNGVREGKPRLNKPPLIYWLQAASAAAFTGGKPKDDAIWMYRVPSVLAALIAVLATWRIGLGMFDPRAAWLGALILAVCPLVAWEAHQARADMLLLACCTVMMLALWRIWHASVDDSPRHAERTTWCMPLLFWFAMGAGIMTKGPIAPLLAVAAVLWLCISTRRWAWLARLRPVVGLLILLACVAPWIALVAKQIGFTAYLDILDKEIVQRATVGSSEGHAAPPGLHTLAAFGLLFPGSLGIIAGVRRAFARGRARKTRDTASATCSPRRAPEWFLLAWLLPTWIVFELITSKLVHYTLPMYPALALLSARGILAVGPRFARWHAWLTGVWIMLAIAGMQFVSPWVAPGATSRAIMREVRELDPVGALPIASLHREDSMLFWTRGRVVRASEKRMKEWFADDAIGARIAVVNDGVDVPKALPSARWVPDALFSPPYWNVRRLPESTPP